MCSTYRKSLETNATNIGRLMEEETSWMTQGAIVKRAITIASKIETVQNIVTEYKRYNNELTSISKAEERSIHGNNLSKIVELSNTLSEKLKLEDEKAKRKLALSKSEQLEGLKLSIFSGLGHSRYLDYYVYYTDFTEHCLRREYSDSTKLRYLKQYAEADAYKLIKNYHSGKNCSRPSKH